MMSRAKYTRLLEKDTRGRDVLVINDDEGNHIWVDLLEEGDTFYLDIETLNKISKYADLSRIDVLKLNRILDNTWDHIVGAPYDPHRIPDQIAFRKFVKAWEAIPHESRRCLGGNIGALFGAKHSRWPSYEEAQDLSKLFNKLLKLKGRGAPKKPNITKAREYLFQECAELFHNLGIRITTSSEDLNFYLIMRAILADKSFPELQVKEIYDHIKKTSLCTR